MLSSWKSLEMELVRCCLAGRVWRWSCRKKMSFGLAQVKRMLLTVKLTTPLENVELGELERS